MNRIYNKLEAQENNQFYELLTKKKKRRRPGRMRKER